MTHCYSLAYLFATSSDLGGEKHSTLSITIVGELANMCHISFTSINHFQIRLLLKFAIIELLFLKILTVSAMERGVQKHHFHRFHFYNVFYVQTITHHQLIKLTHNKWYVHSRRMAHCSCYHFVSVPVYSERIEKYGTTFLL